MWQIRQVQLDALYAVRRAVREGEGSEAEAVEQLARSPHWVWTAIDPQSKLLLSIQGSERTLAMAQARLHQIAQLVALGAPASAPGERPGAQATLDAAARVALCAKGLRKCRTRGSHRVLKTRFECG